MLRVLVQNGGAEHQDPDASLSGAADVRDIHHGACPKEQE